MPRSVISGRLHSPFEPPVALTYAEEIRQLYEFPRVVIAIQHRSLWQDDWGKLAEFPGIAIDQSVLANRGWD